MTIKLYNTKTRSKETFTPLAEGKASLYVCGPTVYERAHLGNARPVLVFDILYRLLRHKYGADNVTYVRNFTDVDDKINARAAETGRDISQITDETIGWFLDDMGTLGALEPDHAPRATQYIEPMIAMIEDLIEKGHAYAKEGHALFRVRSYENYGKLSGRSVDDMIAGARVEVAPYKEDPMDFVLWKPSNDKQPGWDSPWGRGRPGWHIECSAMAYELLGEAFDIHGGGNDLTFPHHENEIAQSACAGHDFANVWMHNEMLQVEGKKMSKSLGNFFTVRDLLDQGVPGEVIRYVMLSTHYRKPMDWTEKKREEAEKTLRKWATAEDIAFNRGFDAKNSFKQSSDVLESLQDDLNSYNALRGISVLADQVNAENGSDEACEKFMAGISLLGFEGIKNFRSNDEIDLLIWLDLLTNARISAMASKDFSEVDRIKSALIDAGIEVRMSKDGVELEPTSNFDPAKLEALT